jgi:hypothetical protein|tara:strand:- start:5231 stop:6280 length:1050 start_codon:yes stop_codon:yes gene_type:complete
MTKTINSRNVHEAFILGVDAFTWDGDVQEQDSRAGATLEFDGPVVTTYEYPCERVLFWEGRDANPFFHFMEGLWMLQGREDVEFLAHYNKGMEAFSDNGFTLNGAYGYRWREFYEKDQLDVVVKRLQDNPDDRRCVVAMWECNNDLDRDTLDTPCNTHIYFKVRNNKLNMTVCCRSNDMIWGAYGANAVHFSMLQEYMAARIGVEVGVYNQVSDSFHVYTELFNSMKEKLPEFDYYTFKYPMVGNPYKTISVFPMVNDPEEFDGDLDAFFRGQQNGFANHFFSDVAIPMKTAWDMHKLDQNTRGAISLLYSFCKAEDWQIACVEWLERRLKGKEEAKDTEAVIGETNAK